MFKSALVFGSALLVLTGCASRPESISASYVSHEKYTHLECDQLDRKMADARDELSRYSDMQNDKANGDAVGVFLIGVPFSQLSGDHEGDVAKWKGEVEAIETAQIKGRCKG